MTVEKTLNPQNRRILVLDHDPDSLAILIEPLRWEGYEVHGYTEEKEALEALQFWRPQIIILDWLPSATSTAFLKKVREVLPHCACLFVSANSSTEAIIEALDSGADDYIVKPFVPLELLARIRTHLRLRDLHEELFIANSKLQELVDIDDLTGLYNMRSLYQKLEFELERAKRFGRFVAVVMLDMDHFKSVNDGHDHLFGSYVLSEVGKIIKANTRNIDIPARYGGDEFLIVLTETNHEGVLYFCERIRQAILNRTFVSGDDSIKLTVSLGFALTHSGENISSKELVRKADHALYDAKRSGRNRVCFYEPLRPANVIDLPQEKKDNKSKKVSGE